MKLRERYKQNKEAKIGDKCKCASPNCNASFIKGHYAQAFCKSKKGTKCKDAYWNRVTPTKKNNTTRISPASRAYLASRLISEPRRPRLHAADVFGPWHDDDWSEGDGGSGVTEN